MTPQKKSGPEKLLLKAVIALMVLLLLPRYLGRPRIPELAASLSLSLSESLGGRGLAHWPLCPMLEKLSQAFVHLWLLLQSNVASLC